MRGQRDRKPNVSIFPEQFRIGDCFTDPEAGDEPHEWELASPPVTFKKSHEVRARVQRPGDPGTAREKYWAAHVKITVRRTTAVGIDRQPSPTPTTSKPCVASFGGSAVRWSASRTTSASSRSARPLPARVGADPGEDPAGRVDLVDAMR